MSYCWVGQTHDFTMLKEEFCPGREWFKNHKVRVDLAYQGFEKEYICKELVIPKKRPRKGELTPEEKLSNKEKSKERIFVEHSIAGLKRYRILMNKLRLKDFGRYNMILSVCAGLWNFKLEH